MGSGESRGVGSAGRWRCWALEVVFWPRRVCHSHFCVACTCASSMLRCVVGWPRAQEALHSW
jgi:hypothetical protein